MKMLAVYVATLFVFVGVDFLWLGRMGEAFYRPAMGGLAMDGFRLAPGRRLLPALCRRRGLSSPSIPRGRPRKLANGGAYGLAVRPRRLWRL